MYYSKEHTWLKITDGIGIVGITDFAQKELGEIVYVEFPNIGDEYEQDEVFGSVEAVKTVSDLFMPVSGKIIETNESLNNNPTLINEKPLDDAWLIKIEIKDNQEVGNLLNDKDYQEITQ
jgi:glycine cleavage system H protein